VRIRLKARETDSRVRYYLTPFVSIIVAFAVIAAVLWMMGVNPAAVYAEIIEASVTSPFGIGDTLAKATPLTLTALAFAFAYRMRILTLGAEGQLFVGAIFAASAGILLSGFPAAVLLPAVMLAGAVGGLLWALVPAFLGAYLGVSIVITTLMLNFVAYNLMELLIFEGRSFLTESISNFPQGRPIAMEAHLPAFGNQSVTWGFVLAVAAVFVVWFVTSRTRLGYNMRVVGDAPRAARYAGVDIRRLTVVVVLGAGALAGLAGATEIAGRTHALDPHGLNLGLGYSGVIIAVLARLQPFGILVTSCIFAGLINSGSAIQSLRGNSVPSEIVLVMMGLILIFALAGDVFVRYRLDVTRVRGVTPQQG
jgi:simple sugar transport system permease protein